MSLDPDQEDELVSKLKLDAKALTLLQGSDTALKEMLDRAFTDSGDAELQRFARLLGTRRRPGGRGKLLTSLGEMVLASFLAVLGIAAFVPALTGLTTPRQLIDYFSGVLAPSLSSGPLYAGASALDFGLAALLMLAAFYTLREASPDIRESALALETSVR